MIKFLKIQYVLGKISKEQLIELVSNEKITIDDYFFIIEEVL